MAVWLLATLVATCGVAGAAQEGLPGGGLPGGGLPGGGQADLPAARFPPRIEWRLLSRQSTGLPSDRITALAVGRGSDLWAGTADAGLLRVREGSVTRLAPAKDGLPDSAIAALALDHEGAVWVGTAGRGLARLLRESWAAWGVKEGLPSNRVTSLLAAEKVLLVGTDAGLAAWSSTGPKGDLWTRTGGLPSNLVTALAPRLGGGCWAGTREGLCWLDDRDRPSILEADGPAWVSAVMLVDKLAFFERPVLVVGSPAGLVVRDGEEPETVLARLGPEQGLPDGRVTALTAVRGCVREFWAGTDGGGLVHLEARKDRMDRPFLEVHCLPPGPGSYADGRIAALASEPGRLYVATAGSGLSLGKLLSAGAEQPPGTSASAGPAAPATAAGAGGPASAAAASATTPSSTACSPVVRLNYEIGLMGPGFTVTAFGAGSRSLWVGFQERGAAVASPPACDWGFRPRVTGGEAEPRACDGSVPHAVTRELTYTNIVVGTQVSDIVVDADGTLWFATMDLGLGRFEKGCFFAVGKAQGVPTQRVRRLIPDRTTGDLYAIAANTHAVTYEDPAGEQGPILPRDLLLKRSGGVWQVMPLAPRERVKELRLNAVLPFRRDGQFYLATSQGLLSFDGRRLKPARFNPAIIDLRTNRPVPCDKDLRERLERTQVRDLFEGPAGVLWLATDAGLFRDAGPPPAPAGEAVDPSAGLAVQIRGTSNMVCWEGSWDDPTRMAYFLGAVIPEENRGPVPFCKGTLYRYQPEMDTLKATRTRCAAYLVTHDAVWCSVPPLIARFTPKPIR